MSPAIARSPLDEARFGFPVATAKGVDLAGVPAILDFCRDHAIRLCIVRCGTAELAAVHALQASGFLLLDTLVYFRRGLQRIDDAPSANVEIRPIENAEAATLRELARTTFRGYQGHYHADPRLPLEQCDDIYADWAYRSARDRDAGSEVFVASANGELVGFATMRLNTAAEGEGVLFGVHPGWQGKGLYRHFMLRGLHWCRDKGASRMIVSTQITNLAVQIAWSRLGFEPSASFYTLHGWFDPA